MHYSLATSRRQNLNLRPGPPPIIRGFGVGFLLPTVGDGYVAAWTDGFDGDRMLNLADINDGGLLTITDLGKPDADPHDVVVRPELAGDLLAYVFAPAGGDLQLSWVKFDR